MERREMKAAAGLAVLAIGGLGALWPMASRWVRLGEERIELRGRVARSDDGAAAVSRLEAQLAEIERRSAEETIPIPADSEVANLIQHLTGELDRLGLAEREITTGAPASGDDVSTMPMSVSMRGEFEAVYEAVRWVEALPRLVRTERLNIEIEEGGRGKAASPTGLVKAELLLSVYFAPRTPAPAGAAGGVASASGREQP